MLFPAESLPPVPKVTKNSLVNVSHGQAGNIEVLSYNYCLRWRREVLVFISDSSTANRKYSQSPWLAAHASKAFNTTSVILCEVQTFPPTTAAVSDGSRQQPGGILTVMGTRHPWLSGIYIKQTNSQQQAQEITQARQQAITNILIDHSPQAINNSRISNTDRGVQVPKDLRTGAFEIKDCTSFLGVYRDL